MKSFHFHTSGTTTVGGNVTPVCKTGHHGVKSWFRGIVRELLLPPFLFSVEGFSVEFRRKLIARFWILYSKSTCGIISIKFDGIFLILSRTQRWSPSALPRSCSVRLAWLRSCLTFNIEISNLSTVYKIQSNIITVFFETSLKSPLHSPNQTRKGVSMPKCSPFPSQITGFININNHLLKSIQLPPQHFNLYLSINANLHLRQSIGEGSFKWRETVSLFTEWWLRWGTQNGEIYGVRDPGTIHWRKLSVRKR